MSSYNFHPGAPSMTAMKYLKTYIPNRTFLPGERFRHYRNMETKVINHHLDDKSITLTREYSLTL